MEKRFNELYQRSCEKNIPVFTEFLNLDEQSLLKKTYLPCTFYGGFDNAERVVAGFGENIAPTDFTIVCLKISPVNMKFAQPLSHRDVLGSVMGLGIKRQMIGDILIWENIGYLFCLEQISSYIKNNLTRVSHTNVTVCDCNILPENISDAKEEKEIIVSSLRIDALVCSVYKLSRKESLTLFKADKVFVNNSLTPNPSYQVKEQDIISVRGFGRFKLLKELCKTKKERLVVQVCIY